MATTPTYTAPDLCTGTWTLQDDTACGNLDSNLQENLAAEAIEISGAPINIFKLLGVHEQGLLVDLTGSGYPLASGSAPGFDASNAFNTSGLGWRSTQLGVNVMTTPSHLGYNFGVKKTITGTNKYSRDGIIRNHITTIKIQQSANAVNRVLQVRVDRSDDGINWKRVDVVNLPDTGNLETINVRASVASNCWRIVPLMFSGAADATAYWEVIKMELMDYEATSIDNIEDTFFQENRDRDYATASLQIKASYTPFDSIGDMSKFGFNLMEQYAFTCSFAKMVQVLGRPIVIGDIMELPAELQYDQHLRGVKKFLEITDVGWASEGFTTGWRPILYRFQASQLIPSVENKDVINSVDAGDQMTDEDFFSNGGHNQLNTVPQRASEEIKAAAQDAVPLTGQDPSTVTSAESAHVVHGYDGRDYGVEDALPPNNLPYTEGFALPDPSTASDGDYFRLNYPVDTNIPSRLFKFSLVKFKWQYEETDRRQTYTSFKPSMKKILESSTRKNLGDL